MASISVNESRVEEEKKVLPNFKHIDDDLSDNEIRLPTHEIEDLTPKIP